MEKMDESKHRKESGIEPEGMWMVVEFLGHHKLAGFVSEEQRWGQVLLRIDIPTMVNSDTNEIEFTTQWYGTHALYCATPVNKTDAIVLSQKLRPKPFSKFDLQREANQNITDYHDNQNQDDDLPF